MAFGLRCAGSGTSVNPEKEIAFFDRFASEHGDYDVLGDLAYARLLALFAACVVPSPGDRCIDLGCGTGAFTRRLARFGLDLTGMDISPRSVERAAERDAGVRYVVGDITATGLPDASFDIIVYSAVLHHFPTRESRLGVLREGHRILRAGGRLFAYDPNGHSPSMWLYRDPRSPLCSRKGKTENEVMLTRGMLREELRVTGFAPLVVRGVGGMTFRYVESSAARLLLPFYNLYERALRFLPFQEAIGTFVVSVAAKPVRA